MSITRKDLGEWVAGDVHILDELTVDGNIVLAGSITLTGALGITLSGGANTAVTTTVTGSEAYTGWALGFYGSTQLTNTSGNIGNAAGGVFEVNFTSAMVGGVAGLVCGAYIGAFSSSTTGGAIPTTGLWIETIAGTGVDMSTTPLISFVTSGAGTESAIAFELGNAAAAKTVTVTSGGMYYHETIHVTANAAARYIPLSTVEGTYTTAYLIQSSLATEATSLTTGAIIAAGGLAVSKDMWLGGGILNVATVASDIVIIANTAAALEVYDSTTKLLAFDTRNTVSSVEVISLTPGAATLPDGAASTRNGVVVKSSTSTLVGVTQVTTAFDGLSFQVEVPTIAQSGGAVTVDKASTMYIAGAPTTGASVTITDAIALEIDGGDTALAINNSTTGIRIGADGTSSGDLYVYGDAVGSYMQYDPDANTGTGRLNLLLSTLRTTLNRSQNTVSVCPRMYYDATAEDESCRNILAETTVEAGVVLTGATGFEINGVNGAVILDTTSTLNGQAYIAGVKGEIRGTGIQTTVAYISAVEGKYNNTVNPGTGSSALFHGWSDAGIVDYGMIIRSANTGSVVTGISIGATTTGIDIGSCTTGISFSGTSTTGIGMSGATLTNDIVLQAGSTITDSSGVSVSSTGGAGAVVGSTCTAVEYGVNGIHKTVLTIDTLGNIALEDKDDGGGIKIYDFPAGHIQITGATCDLVVTSDAAITTSYVMALGSTVGSDGTATLTGTQADVTVSTTVTCTSGDEDFHGAPAAISVVDGTSAAMDLYVNAAVADGNISGAANVTAASGTITIYWINLGTY